MITEPTVFVLGAGASVPYGYPTGYELKIYMIDRFYNELKDLINFDYLGHTNSADLIQKQNEYLAKVDEFITPFKNSSIRSIDRFLNLNKQFVCYGKLAIIIRILTCEVKSPRYFKYHSEFIPKSTAITIDKMDWFSEIFNKMIEGIDDVTEIDKFSQNQISFITFNYDRYLEQSFYHYLTHSFTKLPKDKAHAIVKAINIKHVYGTVAPCIWEENGLNFRVRLTLKQAEAYVKNILLIDERKQCKDFDFGDIFSSAGRVFFLGFGFAKENLKVLGFPNNFCKDKKYYGTAYGRTSKESDDDIENISGLSPEASKIILKDMDCLTLIRHYF